MLKTVDVSNGVPVPDVTGLNMREAQATKDKLTERLREINAQPNGKKSLERVEVLAQMAALDKHLAALKELEAEERKIRNFAGLESPLAEACAATLDADTWARLAADALTRQKERLRAAAERKAKKAAQ